MVEAHFSWWGDGFNGDTMMYIPEDWSFKISLFTGSEDQNLIQLNGFSMAIQLYQVLIRGFGQVSKFGHPATSQLKLDEPEQIDAFMQTDSNPRIKALKSHHQTVVFAGKPWGNRSKTQ